MDKGYFAFKAYGDSVINSEVFISGCSVGQSTVIKVAEDGNFIVQEWNTIVREDD